MDRKDWTKIANKLNEGRVFFDTFVHFPNSYCLLPLELELINISFSPVKLLAGVVDLHRERGEKKKIENVTPRKLARLELSAKSARFSFWRARLGRLLSTEFLPFLKFSSSGSGAFFEEVICIFPSRPRKAYDEKWLNKHFAAFPLPPTAEKENNLELTWKSHRRKKIIVKTSSPGFTSESSESSGLKFSFVFPPLAKLNPFLFLPLIVRQAADGDKARCRQTSGIFFLLFPILWSPFFPFWGECLFFGPNQSTSCLAFSVWLGFSQIRHFIPHLRVGNSLAVILLRKSNKCIISLGKVTLNGSISLSFSISQYVAANYNPVSSLERVSVSFYQRGEFISDNYKGVIMSRQRTY